MTALLLATAGVFGVMAYSVSRRTREIGVRVALGAASGDVLRLIVGQGLRTILIGVAIGIAGALALTRTVESLLFGVTATDPLTFGGVTLVLIGAALVACYIPARRGSASTRSSRCGPNSVRTPAVWGQTPAVWGQTPPSDAPGVRPRRPTPAGRGLTPGQLQ